MPRCPKLTSVLPAIPVALLSTFLALPRGWAQGYEPPGLTGSGQALPAPVPVELPVPVEVSGEELPFTYVTVGSQSCRAPCRLYVQPGLQPVIASGKTSFVSHVEVPRSGARLELWDRTFGYRTAGAILIPTGLLTGSGLWALAYACSYSTGCAVANFTVWPVLGLAAFFTGIGLLSYAANHDRYGLRVAPAAQSVSRSLRLTGIAASPTAEGAAMGATFAF